MGPQCEDFEYFKISDYCGDSEFMQMRHIETVKRREFFTARPNC